MGSLDALFLGTSWPQKFRDEVEFSNARDAWLNLLRGTVHWTGIERFVRLVVDASVEHDKPVDDGELMLLVAGRVEAAKLDQRKLPRDLLPRNALAGSRTIFGPPDDLQLPDASVSAAEQVERFWASTQAALPQDGTTVDALREGVHLLSASGMPVREESALLLPALYATLVARDEELLQDAGDRAVAWALGLRDDSPLIPVVDILLIAPQRGLPSDEVLGPFWLPLAAPADHQDGWLMFGRHRRGDAQRVPR